MRPGTRAIGFGLAAALAGAGAAAREPYEGVWASSPRACRDRDSDSRMRIEGSRFEWYETRCRAESVRSTGGWSWSARMSCEGEGQRFRVQPRITLSSPDRLVMDNSPVGPGRRQTYGRCTGG